METTKTRKLVLSAALAALGMILGLLEIPYPLAPWLNLDLSEIVVIMAISMLGFKSALFVCVCKFFVSILFKGPVGPIAIGQITDLLCLLLFIKTFKITKRMAVLCREHDYYNVCICNGNVYFELPVCNSNLFNSKTNLVYRFTICFRY